MNASFSRIQGANDESHELSLETFSNNLGDICLAQVSSFITKSPYLKFSCSYQQNVR